MLQEIVAKQQAQGVFGRANTNDATSVEAQLDCLRPAGCGIPIDERLGRDDSFCSLTLIVTALDRIAGSAGKLATVREPTHDPGGARLGPGPRSRRSTELRQTQWLCLPRWTKPRHRGVLDRRTGSCA